MCTIDLKKIQRSHLFYLPTKTFKFVHLVSISVVTKYTDKSNLMEKEFNLAHSSRGELVHHAGVINHSSRSRRLACHSPSAAQRLKANRKWGWSIKPQGPSPLAYFVLQDSTFQRFPINFPNSTLARDQIPQCLRLGDHFTIYPQHYVFELVQLNRVLASRPLKPYPTSSSFFLSTIDILEVTN